MEDYLSERQQIEHVKGVVRANAPYAIVGIVLGVGALLGWRQWHTYVARQSVAAHDAYASALEALGRGDAAKAATLVAELRGKYARTPYADLAGLALARLDVETGKLDDAAHYLNEVAASSQDQDLKGVARLRLARVQRAQGKPDAALATLASAAPSAAAADVRGDVLSDEGDKAGALNAWREALASKMPGAVNRELVELKIAALDPAGGAHAPAVSSAPAAPAAVVSGAKP